jgi:hypothetical protein
MTYDRHVATKESVSNCCGFLLLVSASISPTPGDTMKCGFWTSIVPIHVAVIACCSLMQHTCCTRHRAMPELGTRLSSKPLSPYSLLRFPSYHTAWYFSLSLAIKVDSPPFVTPEFLAPPYASLPVVFHLGGPNLARESSFPSPSLTCAARIIRGSRRSVLRTS